MSSPAGQDGGEEGTPASGASKGMPGSGTDQVEALRVFAQVKGVPGVERPKIRLPGDNFPLSQFAAIFWAFVREKGVFRRDTSVWLLNGAGQLVFLDPHMLLMWGEAHVEFVKMRAKTSGDGEKLEWVEVRKSLPVEAAKCTLAAVRVEPAVLLEVERVNRARMPVMREEAGNVQRGDRGDKALEPQISQICADEGGGVGGVNGAAGDGDDLEEARRRGRIELLAPGYDEEARTFTFDEGVVIDESWTVEMARRFFLHEWREFPFGDGVDGPERSQGVMVACLLTLFCGGLLDRRSPRPMFTFNANAAGSGKTLLAKYVLYSVYGTADAGSWIEQGEEFRKDLDTRVGSGAPYIFYDNVKCRIDSADLEKFVTSSSVSFRPMGKNTEMVCVPNVATVLITSNNAAMSPDLARRSLFVNLFVHEADVQERRIERPMDEGRLCSVGHRGKVLSALWALVRAWDAAGRPDGKGRLVTFEEWSRVIGGICEVGGFGDPLAKANIRGVGDTDGDMMRVLVRRLLEAARYKRAEDGSETNEERWESVKGPALPGGGPGPQWRAFTFGQLCDVCGECGLFDYWVPDTGSAGMKGKERSGFGKLLMKFISSGRVFSLVRDERPVKVALRWNGEEGRAKRFLVGEMVVG